LAGGDLLLLTVGDRLGGVRTFDEEDRRLFEALAGHAAAAVDQGRLVDQLRAETVRRTHQALHDPLTGLPNRTHFVEAATTAIAVAQAQGHRLAVVLLDLDGFKQVNDTLGHRTGDDLLREVGRRLRAATRAGELASRLGGDEFAVLLDLGPGGHQSGLVAQAVGRLVGDLERPVEVDGLDLEVRVSAGAAVVPEPGVGLDELLQRADAAMYDAKRTRARGAVADVARGTRLASGMALAGDLRRALERGELVVDYQPAADLRTGQITAAEALVRWQHPELGRLAPDVFIPVAEQAGLVTALTYEVLQTALGDAASWARAGHEIDIAVNVAGRTLLDPDFPVQVLSLLSSRGTAACRLTLEVSEAALVAGLDRTEQVLEHLARAGVRLAVDDVGTGSSSLPHLGRLPLTEFKIDGRFVRNATGDAHARTLVRSAIDLAHGLGLRVVAEGMENQLTWDLLLEMGCDRGQGYLLSPPLPPHDLHSWLVQRALARSPAILS
jgi:diguanylate cyclase (GGDEF)-like protein